MARQRPSTYEVPHQALEKPRSLIQLMSVCSEFMGLYFLAEAPSVFLVLMASCDILTNAGLGSKQALGPFRLCPPPFYMT
jgi:hypothetical protein